MFTPRIIVCANILSHRIENRRDAKALNWICPSLGRRLGRLIRVRRLLQQTELLGKLLMYDTQLSVNRNEACAFCPGGLGSSLAARV